MMKCKCEFSLWILRALGTLVLVGFFLPGVTQALSKEGHALLHFKQNISDPSNQLRDWNQSSTWPCSWIGVTCTSNSVTGLNFSYFNLWGAVPEGIFGQLTNLSSLDIGNTNLGGSFPSDLLSCTKLVFLNMSFTYMEGPLPHEISKLRSLEMLDFQNTNFAGPIPDSFGDLPSLKYLRLMGANFTGMLPSSLGNLTNLTEIHLGYANFTVAPIPAWIGKLVQLKVLQLESCNLNGSIPSFLQNLTVLENLWLKNNMLDGIIPEVFGNMTVLSTIDLSMNNLTGNIPSGLMLLPYLKVIELYENSLTGEIPDMGKLQSLTDFDVSQNNLSGTIPPSIAKLTTLRIIHLQQNYLQGEIPSGIAELENLSEFVVFSNQLSGTVPSTFGEKCSLFRFDVSTNSFTGSVPPNLCNGNRLIEFILKENSFTGVLPEAYGDCTSLVRVELEGNQMTGPIPNGLWGAPHMTLLTMQDNQFNGTISPTIGQALQLGTLYIDNNQFTGLLPGEIGQINSLIELYVSGNELSGTIPLQLGKLSQVTDLHLDRNSFSGSIPPEIGSCTHLVVLNLSMNHLTGSIPSELGNPIGLSNVDVSYNQLSGEVPLTLDDLPLETLDISYNNLSGELPSHLTSVANIKGNPNLCDSNSNCSTSPGLEGRKGDRSRLIAGVVGGTFAAAAFIFVMGSCCFYRRYKHYTRRVDKLRCDSWSLTSFQKMNFRDHEVTDLDEDNVIGSGGSGKVYKATLSNGQSVAVKKLWGERKGNSLHDYGFKAEVETLGNIRHRNIVKLLCCCSNGECNLLVYEYMPHGSLGDLLHGSREGKLDWEMRYKIALGAAQGLEYLHHDCMPQILHRDVKSNNILLDSNYEARLADFGLAKVLEVTNGHAPSMSTVAGSYGYIAPEYAYTLKVGEKSDIYSFGVILLELVTGKPPIKRTLYGDDVDLVKWVSDRLQTKEAVYEILDPSIEKQYQEDMILLLRMGLLCTSMLPMNRPSMREVVQMLLEADPKNREQTCGSEGRGDFVEVIEK